MKKIKQLTPLIYGLLLWFVTHLVVIVADGLTDEQASGDYIVIFGNTVNADGTVSQRLKARLDKGIELYRNNVAKSVIVSGGLGIEGHYEGTVMKNYLMSRQIPATDIFVDDFGNNTMLTAINFSRTHGTTQSVIVVSQFFHISRCKLALKKVGVHTVHGVSSDYYEWRDVYSAIREFFAFYQYLMSEPLVELN